MNGDCDLCGIGRGLYSSGFSRLFGETPPVREIVAESPDVLVVLDVAPIAVGHVLITTRSHERSFAKLWHDAPQRVIEVEEAVVAAISQLTGASAVVCEHGLGLLADGHVGCVDHAHLHVIPTRACLISTFFKAGVEFRELPAGALVPECAPRQQYLYLRDSDGRRYVAARDQFPSQLIRRLVAHQHAEIFWSWRDYLDFATAIGTQERIISGAALLKALGEDSVFRY